MLIMLRHTCAASEFVKYNIDRCRLQKMASMEKSRATLETGFIDQGFCPLPIRIKVYALGLGDRRVRIRAGKNLRFL